MMAAIPCEVPPIAIGSGMNEDGGIDELLKNLLRLKQDAEDVGVNGTEETFGPLIASLERRVQLKKDLDALKKTCVECMGDSAEEHFAPLLQLFESKKGSVSSNSVPSEVPITTECCVMSTVSADDSYPSSSLKLDEFHNKTKEDQLHNMVPVEEDATNSLLPESEEQLQDTKSEEHLNVSDSGSKADSTSTSTELEKIFHEAKPEFKEESEEVVVEPVTDTTAIDDAATGEEDNGVASPVAAAEEVEEEGNSGDKEAPIKRTLSDAEKKKLEDEEAAILAELLASTIAAAEVVETKKESGSESVNPADEDSLVANDTEAKILAQAQAMVKDEPVKDGDIALCKVINVNSAQSTSPSFHQPHEASAKIVDHHLDESEIEENIQEPSKPTSPVVQKPVSLGKIIDLNSRAARSISEFDITSHSQANTKATCPLSSSSFYASMTDCDESKASKCCQSVVSEMTSDLPKSQVSVEHPCTNENVEALFDEISELLVINAELFYRCIGSMDGFCTETDRTSFTRYGYDSIKVLTGERSTQLATGATTTTMLFDLKPLSQLPLILDGCIDVKYKSYPFSMFISYEKIVESVRNFHDEVLELFLPRLKAHLEDVYLCLFNVDEWLREADANVNFIESTFGIKLDRPTEADFVGQTCYCIDGSHAKSYICLQCQCPLTFHKEVWDDHGLLKKMCPKSNTFFKCKDLILKTFKYCDEDILYQNGFAKRTFMVEDVEDQFELTEFLNLISRINHSLRRAKGSVCSAKTRSSVASEKTRSSTSSSQKSVKSSNKGGSRGSAKKPALPPRRWEVIFKKKYRKSAAKKKKKKQQKKKKSSFLHRWIAKVYWV